MKRVNLTILVTAFFAFVVPAEAVSFLGPPARYDPRPAGPANPLTPVSVPESGSTFVLLSGGLIAVAALRRKLTK